MKKSVFLLFAFICTAPTLFSQSSCSKFYPFSEGVTSQISLYDDKGKPQGMVEYNVLSTHESNGGTVANMSTKLFDKKGTEVSNTTYDATCHDGMVSIDFKSLMRPGMLDAYGDMDVESQVSGTNLDIPNNISVGQTLPDAEMTITISISGMNINMNTLITDRKVEAKETVTTPAGAFDCYVISQSTVMKTMTGSMKRSSKQWIAEGVGVVKTEDYNKRGKLEGSGLLTSFSK